MKRFITHILSFPAALILATSTPAQSVTYVVDSFDPGGTGGQPYNTGQITNVWMNWFGDAFRSATWDASDAGNNPGSGSMKITAVFDGSGSIPDQFEVFDNYNGIVPPLNGLQYTNFQCDIRFDPGSATVLLGGTPVYGYLMFGTRNGYDQDYFGGIAVPSGNTNWVHVSLNLNPAADTNLLNINDVLIHIYGPYYGPSLSGTTVVWVDNIKFTGIATAPTNCVVDWNDVHQKIDGFGASSAWDGTWTTSQADMFFSTNTGIGLSLLRNRIDPDGTTWETSLMQMAQDRGARIWSTPWSPPAIYKDSGTVNGGNFLSASNQAYANQLAKYVLSMKNAGINLYAISVQNEPDYNTTNYESCIWTGQQIHDFVPYLYNALSNNGVASTKILIAEDANWKFDLTTASINDPVTSNEVQILAAHPYDYKVAPANRYDKSLWETEISTFDPYDGSIANGMYWASQIHTFLTYAEVNAWHFWWLIPYATDNESLTDSDGNPAKRMYVLGQYSRFIRPGYYRIGVANNTLSSISAYKDNASGRFAIVALNTGSTTVTQTFNFKGFTAPVVTPWITSDTLSLASQPAVSVTNAAFTYALPAMSVVTFVGQASYSPPTITAIAHHGGQMTLTVSGPTGPNYSLLTSTDLVNWQTLLTTNSPPMPVTLSDTNPETGPSRFYRVQLGP